MDIETLKILEKAVVTAQAIRSVARDEFAVEHTKLKIGDTVTVTGHSHNGKPMIVEKILFRDDWQSGKGVVAWGSVLKKDGTVSAYAGYHLEIAVD